MDARKVYEYALEREREGVQFFQSNAERMSHASAKGIFEQLAAEELMHIEFIEVKLQTLGKGPPVSTNVELEGAGFFTQRAASELLDQTVMESMVPDLPILRMAYLIERDLAEFYSTMTEQAQGDVKEALQTLARWERTHEELFKHIHDSIFQEYMNMPWGG
jgi:rubrerythrin